MTQPPSPTLVEKVEAIKEFGETDRISCHQPSPTIQTPACEGAWVSCAGDELWRSSPTTAARSRLRIDGDTLPPIWSENISRNGANPKREEVP